MAQDELQEHQHTSVTAEPTLTPQHAMGGALVPAPYGASRPEPTSVQIMQVQAAYEDARKSPAVMWLLWFFLGGVGAHRYYLRSYGYAIGMTLTLGCFGLWTLVDAFLIGRRMGRVNAEIRRDIYGRHGITAL